MQQPGERDRLFNDSLVADLVATSQKYAVEATEDIIRREIEFWSPHYFHPKTSWIQCRYNHKPGKKPTLNWRCEVMLHSDLPLPSEMIKSHPQGGAQFSRKFGELISILSKKFPTYSLGLDFDTKLGVVKAWHFGKHDVSDVYTDLELRAEVPAAVSKYHDFFEKYGFSEVYCTGVDYVNNSMNFYFIFNGFFGRSVDDVKNILHDCGFDSPTKGENCDFQSLLGDCSRASAFATTFRWDSDQVERVCFYTPKDCIESKEAVEFAEKYELPTKRDKTGERKANSFVGFSFGVDGHYKKIETDYNKSYFHFLGKMMEYRDEEYN